MKRLPLKDTVLLILVLVALGQVAFFGARWAFPNRGLTSWLEPGDDVSALQARAPSGRKLSLSGEHLTVLLVFDSQCGHCRNVAPAWGDWIEAAPVGVEVFGVSAEAHETATAFVEEEGLGVEVWRVDGPRGSLEHALTSRAPWVFVLDREGRILAEGQGTRLAELTEVLGEGSTQGGSR